MCNDGYQEYTNGYWRGMVDKMIDGIIISHQHGKGIMPGYGQQGSSNGYRKPIFIAYDIEDVLDGRKSQSDAYGIDNTVEVLVEIGILAKQQPQEEQLHALLGKSSDNKGIV